jgi:ribosomal protein S18 acetylase RimI-like enzyme
VLVRQWAEGEAWIALVGTRQQARGQGLARACLTASLRACAEQGYRTAALGVDSNNGQGAGALYSSLGFGVIRTFASYGKVIPPL